MLLCSINTKIIEHEPFSVIETSHIFGLRSGERERERDFPLKVFPLTISHLDSFDLLTNRLNFGEPVS